MKNQNNAIENEYYICDSARIHKFNLRKNLCMGNSHLQVSVAQKETKYTI
jgi:hypothetical protein